MACLSLMILRSGWAMVGAAYTVSIFTAKSQTKNVLEAMKPCAYCISLTSWSCHTCKAALCRAHLRVGRNQLPYCESCRAGSTLSSTQAAYKAGLTSTSNRTNNKGPADRGVPSVSPTPTPSSA